MAKPSWAKVYVDLRHHPKLFNRPDADKWLWTCLMLHAKEHCPDFIVRGLSASDMRGMFGIKASVKVVQAALDHLASIGWAVPIEGGLFLAHMEERQRAAGDTPEQHAKRQAKYHAKAKADDVTRKPDLTSQRHRDLTSYDGDRSDAEAEADSEADPEEAKKIAAGASALPVSPVEIEPRLLDGWPPGLLAQVKDAVAATRKSGMIAPGPWRAFLVKAIGFSAGIRIRAAETYLERACAAQGMKENYLLGIMRGENGQSQASLPIRTAVSGSHVHISDQSKTEAKTPGRKFI